MCFHCLGAYLGVDGCTTRLVYADLIRNGQTTTVVLKRTLLWNESLQTLGIVRSLKKVLSIK